MRIALALANGRIAPVFDVARQVLLIDLEAGKVQSDSLEDLPLVMPAAKVIRLSELGIEELICGAISWPVRNMIEAQGIRVFGFVAGDIDQVVEARLSGALDDPRYAMPGCLGGGRRCGLQGGRPGFGRGLPEKGMNMNNNRISTNMPGSVRLSAGSGQGRGSGRGGGQGQGAGRGGGQGQGAGRGGGRGKGQGGGMGLAAGPEGACVCPECGRRIPHQRGVPCTEQRCPECGVALLREQTS